MRKQKLQKLLMKLSEIQEPAPKQSMSQSEVGKWVYNSKIGKKVIDELRENQVSKTELQEKGFITAMISIGNLL